MFWNYESISIQRRCSREILSSYCRDYCGEPFEPGSTSLVMELVTRQSQFQRSCTRKASPTQLASIFDKAHGLQNHSSTATASPVDVGITVQTGHGLGLLARCGTGPSCLLTKHWECSRLDSIIESNKAASTMTTAAATPLRKEKADRQCQCKSKGRHAAWHRVLFGSYFFSSLAYLVP